MGEKRISEEVINGIKKFKEKTGIEEVIVFGSYASGKTHENSDIDLVLISKKFEGRSFHERLKGLWIKWPLDLPVDFIPYTPAEFRKKTEEASIAKEAKKTGITI